MAYIRFNIHIGLSGWGSVLGKTKALMMFQSSLKLGKSEDTPHIYIFYTEIWKSGQAVKRVSFEISWKYLRKYIHALVREGLSQIPVMFKVMEIWCFILNVFKQGQFKFVCLISL